MLTLRAETFDANISAAVQISLKILRLQHKKAPASQRRPAL